MATLHNPLPALRDLLDRYSWEKLKQAVSFLTTPPPDIPSTTTHADFPEEFLGWRRYRGGTYEGELLPCLSCCKLVSDNEISHGHSFPKDYDCYQKYFIPVCKTCLPLIHVAAPNSYEECLHLSSRVYREQHYQREVLNHALKELEELKVRLERVRETCGGALDWVAQQDQLLGEARAQAEAKADTLRLLREQLQVLTQTEERLQHEISERQDNLRVDLTSALRSVTTLVQGHFQQLVQTAIRELPPPTVVSTPVCSICKHTRVDTALACGHVFCHNDAHQLKTCPLCQRPAAGWIHLYL